MNAYPFDSKGTAVTNHFTEERIIESDDPAARVVILQHRPFYQGLTVRMATATNPLTEGTDFEYAYQLTPLDDSLAFPVFCGVNLINPAINGKVIFDGQLVGGTYYDGFVEQLDELVKYLNNPSSADWLKVDKRPSLFPVIPAATSWADMLNKKYIASAVHDVELDAGAANDLIKEKLDALKSNIEALGAEIDAFNYAAHIAANNPHGTTAAQVNAHPVSLKTPDTFLAFGKNLRTLTAEIRALGIQQSDIDKYIEQWVFKDIKGTYVQMVAPNRPLFKSANGTADILFTDTSFELRSNGGMALAAGFKPDGASPAFIEWKSGTNVLRIESSGSVFGMDKLTLNGKMLLTTTTLLNYQGQGSGSEPTDPDDTKLWINGDGIVFTGKGSKADPVKGTVTPPTATTTVAGAVALKATKGAETSGVAATPQALDPYGSQLATFVPKATRLNSVPMDDGSRTMTKADLGLGNVDNTADVDKPLSTDLQAGLDGLAAKAHKHAWSELNVPTATYAGLGIARFAASEAQLATGKGVAPVVLYQLGQVLDVVAEKLKDANPKAVTDYSVIGDSTWTVASSKKSLSVQDMKYFYMSAGERKESVVTGSINLETTPMFNWFSPDNIIETQWQKGVIHNTQLPSDAIAPTNLMLLGKSLGLTASQVGDLSVISLLAKERVVCKSGILNVYAVGGGNITILVDDIQVATGASPLAVQAEVDASLTMHTVAIRVDCNDSAKPAAIGFDIWDDLWPVVCSTVDTRITQLAEFINPLNVRHYLYMNMKTGSLFGRAEPIQSVGLDVERTLIGFVDTDGTGVPTTTVSFTETVDFGRFNELETHRVAVPAHVPKTTDWFLADNPSMKRIGVGRLPATWAVGSPVGSAGAVSLPSGILRVLINGASATDRKLAMWLDNRTQSPQGWVTPANPYSDNLLTFEGSLVLELEKGKTLGTDLWLTFATGGINGQHKVVKFNPFLGTAEYGYTPTRASNSGVPVVVGLETLRAMDAHPYDQSDMVVTAANAFLYDVFDITSAPRYVLRYRYTPDTNVLKIILTYYTASTIGNVLKVSFELPFDVRECFTGWVGLERKAQRDLENIRMMPGLFPLHETVGEVHDIHYLRSLLEAYVHGADRDRYPGRGLQQKLLDSSPQANFATLGAYTEFIRVPTRGGKPTASGNRYLPLAFSPNPPASMPFGTDMPQARMWKNAANPNRGLVIPASFAMLYVVDQPFDRLNFQVTSNHRFRVMGKGVQLFSDMAVNGSTVTDLGSSNLSFVEGDIIWFEILTPVNPIPLEFDVTMTTTLNGVVVESFKIDDKTLLLFEVDKALYLCKTNPFNMTTATWDWAKGVAATESGASATLGDWN